MLSTAHGQGEGLPPLLCGLIFQHCIKVSMPQYKKEIELLESIQWRVTKLVGDLEAKTYEEQLRALDLFSPEQRNWGEALWQPAAPHREQRGQLSSDSNRAQGNSMELYQGKAGCQKQVLHQRWSGTATSLLQRSGKRIVHTNTTLNSDLNF